MALADARYEVLPGPEGQPPGTLLDSPGNGADDGHSRHDGHGLGHHHGLSGAPESLFSPVEDTDRTL
ncbi:hypothetical protein ACH4U5_37730 [Streptomyces sp. NPDC020858]|uniref:hypothetical protein n=1 Tax=Streptomyces sp. NPDC020858 TaxID=3365097 RepID=UPI0037BBBAA5